jgi:hypothetical protein
MIQIPYGAIGIGIAVILAIWAYSATSSTAWRITIGAALFAVIGLRTVWHGPPGQIAQLVLGTLVGIVSYLFIKARGANIR